MRTFSIEANFDADDPESEVECSVHSGDLSFTESKAAMIRFRDHLTVRIEAAAKECPAMNRSLISPKIVTYEYMRCAIVKNHPDIPSHHYDEIGKDNMAKYQTEGIKLAAKLSFDLSSVEFDRTIDEFSDLHIAPVVNKKYG